MSPKAVFEGNDPVSGILKAETPKSANMLTKGIV
jgi:hypothetical protein